MAILEQLIGKPLDQCTREELENWVMKGRLAREAEAEGARAGKTRKAGTAKKKSIIPDFDLLDDDELELED